MVAPLKKMKEQYGSKEKLVAAVTEALKPYAGKDIAGLTAKLKEQSNQKLLKLHEAAKKITEIGGKDAAVEAIVSASKKANESMRAKLSQLPVNELVSRYAALKGAAVGKVNQVKDAAKKITAKKAAEPKVDAK